MIPNLFTTEIDDNFIRENFRRLVDFFRKEPIFLGDFKFFTYTFTKGETKDIPHQLGFQPVDVIQLSATKSAVITWNYDKFTKTTVNVGSTVPCTVRAYIGRHKEGA